MAYRRSPELHVLHLVQSRPVPAKDSRNTTADDEEISIKRGRACVPLDPDECALEHCPIGPRLDARTIIPIPQAAFLGLRLRLNAQPPASGIWPHRRLHLVPLPPPLLLRDT